MTDLIIALVVILSFLFTIGACVLSMKTNARSKDLCRERLVTDLATGIEKHTIGRTSRTRSRQAKINDKLEEIRRQRPEYNIAVILAKFRRTIEIFKRILQEKIKKVKTRKFRFLVLNTGIGYNKVIAKIIIRGSREGKERILRC